MSSQIMNLLMLGGVVVVGYFVWINKDTLFAGIGGGTAFGDTGAGDVVTNVFGDEDNPNQTGGAVGGTDATVGCCHCKMVNGRAKCEKNGDGAWWNPPAGSGGSNDQDLLASATSCSKTQCGGAATTSTANKAVGGGTSAKVGSEGNPGYKAPTTNKPATGNIGAKGTVYVKPKATATGSASYLNKTLPAGKSYKPGGGTYYTQRVAFMTNTYKSIYPRMSVV